MDRPATPDRDKLTTEMTRFNLLLQPRHLGSLELSGRTVLVRNIPDLATIPDLLEIASSTGRVIEIRVLRADNGAKEAYIEFASALEANAFIESGNRMSSNPELQLEMIPAHDNPVTVLRNYGRMTIEEVKTIIFTAMGEARTAIVAMEAVNLGNADEFMKITFNNQRVGLRFIKLFNNLPSHIPGQTFSATWFGSPILWIPDAKGISDKDNIRRSFAPEHQNFIKSIILCKNSIYVTFEDYVVFLEVMARQRGVLAVAGSKSVLEIRRLNSGMQPRA